MSRPRRFPTQHPATRQGGASSGAFDGLAELRRRLIAHPAPTASAPTKAPRRAPAAAADDDEQALLHSALRDVQPLATAHQRAELARPAPPPMPRPKTGPADENAPAPRRERRLPHTDAELFRVEMEDVAPLACEGRAEVGVDRHRSTRRKGAAPLHDVPANLPLTAPRIPESASAEELFRYAVRGAQPIDTRNRAALEKPAPPPRPLKHIEDEREALRESLENAPTLEDRLEMGDETSFLRPGLPRRVLTDLRRGRWVLQGQLDLHGLNRDQAREALSQFIVSCLQQGKRCVRVIHGKGLGSPGRESILKQLSRGWLAQREDILAFCQAGPHDGGAGALLVLLRTGNPARS